MRHSTDHDAGGTAAAVSILRREAAGRSTRIQSRMFIGVLGGQHPGQGTERAFGRLIPFDRPGVVQASYVTA